MNSPKNHKKTMSKIDSYISKRVADRGKEGAAHLQDAH
jgi:hypothetical protein